MTKAKDRVRLSDIVTLVCGDLQMRETRVKPSVDSGESWFHYMKFERFTFLQDSRGRRHENTLLKLVIEKAVSTCLSVCLSPTCQLPTLPLPAFLMVRSPPALLFRKPLRGKKNQYVQRELVTRLTQCFVKLQPVPSMESCEITYTAYHLHTWQVLPAALVCRTHFSNFKITPL